MDIPDDDPTGTQMIELVVIWIEDYIAQIDELVALPVIDSEAVRNATSRNRIRIVTEEEAKRTNEKLVNDQYVQDMLKLRWERINLQKANFERQRSEELSKNALASGVSF